MTVHDVVIVGGGIAGLAAAWELRRRGVDALVLESSWRPGGVIVTERFDGFVVDGGPDSLLVQKPAALELCAELGLRDRLLPTRTPRTAFVLRGRQLVPLPEASFLGLPTQVRPFVASRLFSWRGKTRMATEVLRPAREAGDESIGSFIRRRFGNEAVEYLAEPLLAGIHAGDVDQLSVGALFPRLVGLERQYGSVLRGLRAAGPKLQSPHGAFVSLPDGMQELPDALASALGPDAVRLGTTVAQISGGPPYRLTLETDASIRARAVIVATPAWAAARMLRSLDGVLAGLCDDIPYASTATVACGFERRQIDHALQGTGFVVPRRERRALMASTWVSSKWPYRAPADHVLIRGFLGGAADPQVLARSDAALASAVLDELAPLLRIAGSPLFVRVFRWRRATPQYVVGHARRIRAIDERLARLPGVYVTGSGYRGTGIPDCIADARATAATVSAFLRDSGSARADEEDRGSTSLPLV